jgi:hypothetical protein
MEAMDESDALATRASMVSGLVEVRVRGSYNSVEMYKFTFATGSLVDQWVLMFLERAAHLYSCGLIQFSTTRPA